MKALVVALIIAISGSIAAADVTSCPLADSNFMSGEGAYTPKNARKAIQNNSHDQNVVDHDSKGITK